MKKAKILIVEDEAIIAMEIESQLRSLGHKVTSIVDTGEKAIEKAEEDKPDLILMDIRIKGEKDGIEAAEEIRHRFGIPVIFSTAYLDEERIERAKITMPFGYVLKPIQERNLRVTIEMAVHVSKVDAERRKAEETYRGIFLNSQVGLFRTDIESGFLIDANDSLARFAGYKNREEFLAQPFSIAERYVDVVAREKMISLLKKNGEVNNHEIRFRRDDDSIIWLRFSAKTIPDKGWMEGVSEDVTKEKEIEKALKESEEKFKTIAEFGCDWAHKLEFDENGRIIPNPVWAMEQKILEKTGYTVEEIVRFDSFEEYVHPDDIDLFKERYKRVLSGEEIDDFEFRMKHKEGHYFWIQETAHVEFDENTGKPENIVIIARDITERKKAEQRVVKSEHLFGQMFEQSKISTQLYDPDGTCIRVNPQFRELFGVNTDEITDGRYNVFKDQAAIDSGVIPLVKEIFEEKKTKKWVTNIDVAVASESTDTPSAIKEKVWIDVLGYPILDSEGNLDYVILQHYDITDRKQAEEDLQKVHDELERKVEQRTFELAENNQKLHKEINDRIKAEAELRESEERFRILFKNTPIAYQSLDESGNIIEINQAWLDELGYEREEILGKNFSEILPQEYQDVFRERFPKFKKVGYIMGHEFKLICKNGAEKLVAFDGKIGRDQSGNFKQTHCVFRPIENAS